jgi:uncharacterized protein
MNSIIEQNKEQIIELCKKHHVKELSVFGSVVTDKFNEDSDVDFLYSIDLDGFKDWATGKYDYTDNLLSLESALLQLLKRPVDLIPMEVQMQNKYMKRSIERTKQIVYAA